VGIWIGVDIAKHVHWATAIDDVGQVLVDQRVANDPIGIQGLIDGLAGLGGEPVIGLDVVGGIAALAQAMLQAAGFRLVHVSGLAVNRARQGTTGGEHKSDPRDARVIAELVRSRRDLRPIEPVSELELELRLLVGRRGDLQVEQTRRLARLHDLLVGIHPGLERVLDLTTKGGLWLAARDVTPAEIRAVGREGLMAHLQAAGGLSGRQIQTLADRALVAAAAQQLAVPGERLAARLVRELAVEALACRQRLIELDAELDRLLERHPDAALIRSLPGMGAVLTAELIAEAGTLARYRSADALAAAAGLAPVLRQSGKVRFQRRPSAATRPSSGSSTSRRSARCPRPTAAPSTPANAARANATTRL